MKIIRYFFLLLFAVVIISCSNNLTSWVISDVTDYSNCTTNKEFQEWLFSINSDGKTIEQAGVKFNVRNIYDPETSIPGIMIEIVEGVAEYHKEEFLNEMVAKLKADLKNQRLVLSIYPEYDWVIINLVNEHEFNNVN